MSEKPPENSYGWVSETRWLWHGGVMYFWSDTDLCWVPSVDRELKTAEFDHFLVGNNTVRRWIEVLERQLMSRAPDVIELEAWYV